MDNETKKTNTVTITFDAEITLVVNKDNITLSHIEKFKELMVEAIKKDFGADDFHARNINIKLFDI